jgi:hypothetical protein
MCKEGQQNQKMSPERAETLKGRVNEGVRMDIFILEDIIHV